MNRSLRRNSKSMLPWLALATALAAGCASIPDTTRYNPPPQGSTWTNAIRTTGSYGNDTRQATTTMGTELWQGRQRLAYRGSPVTVIADDGGCWITWLNGTTPVFTWDPPICSNRPFVVGDVHSKKIRVTVHQTKQTVDLDARWKIEAYEEVRVPAGTFNAFKISYVDNVGNERIDWGVPELGITVKSSIKRTAAHRQGAGTQESELVSHTIKR